MSIDIKTSREVCDAAYDPDWVDRYGEVCVVRGGNLRQIGAFENPANARLAAHARTALPAALDEIERLRSALTIARQGLRNCRYAATPVQADEWATDALLRSSIEEHLAEADTGGKS